MPQKYSKILKFFVLYSRGGYGGNGTGNDRVYVTEGAPRKNQSGEIPERFPSWLGSANGISTTVLRGYTTEDAARAGEKYYARKYGV